MSSDSMQLHQGRNAAMINILKSVIGEFAVISFCHRKRKLYGYLIGVNDVFIILEAEELDYRIEVETIRSIQYNNMLYCPTNAPLSIRQKYGNILIKVSLGDDKINSLIHYDEDEFLKEDDGKCWTKKSLLLNN